MSDDEYDDNHSETDGSGGGDSDIDEVGSGGDDYDDTDRKLHQEGGGSDDDQGEDDEDDDDDNDDDDEETAQDKELKELHDEAQHMYDECSVEQPAATDYSSYFQSNIMSVNDKERDLKSQHVTFKEASLRQTTIRRTLPILTKYEKAKIIGVRAQQISMGSPAYLSEEDVRKCGGGSGSGGDPLLLAQEELRQKRTPLIVRRTLDSKMCAIYEDWYISDLIDPFEHL
jgi:DNA-directed RNA polymerase I, II, and III subunit RPABC2